MYFCLLKTLKSEFLRCFKNFLKFACHSGNISAMMEMFSIFSFRKCSTLVKSGPTKKKFLKNPKKLVKNLSACFKQLFYRIHGTTCFYVLHFLFWARLYSPCLFYSQSAFTFSKFTIETLEQGVKKLFFF